jgi:hypothetical protein
VAIAAALPGVIFALTDYRTGYVATGLGVLFFLVSFLAWKWYRNSILCDAVLLLALDESALRGATSPAAWIFVENRGNDDAFDIRIATIGEGRQAVGFPPIPIARRGERTPTNPSLFKESGVTHPSLAVHPPFFGDRLAEGSLIPNTTFNRETIVEIEFRDKDDFTYRTRNRIDFHQTQKTATVFYLETRRL